jgi:hypothetical protein
MNDGNEDVELDPPTVSADAIVPIRDLIRNEGEDQFKSGDCFQLEFSDMKSYEDKLAGHYWPIVDEVTECQFNVAATCERLDKFQYKVTLGADVPKDANDAYSLSGTLGKIKNPYSQHNLNLIEIRYYGGCSSETPEDTTAREFSGGFSLEITPAEFPASEVSFGVTREMVGDADRTNVATFTFTPKTKLSYLGGYIRISTPQWYSST